MTPRLRTLTIVLFVACGLAAIPAATASHRVECGATITRDTVLDRDLVNCPGHGLVIGADGVTLDLNGHTIDGQPGHFAVGVLSEGYDDLTVVNGAVREFVEGVVAARGERIVFRRLTGSHLGHMAFIVDTARHVTIEDNTSIGNLGGIGAMASSRVRIARNVVRDAEFVGIVTWISRNVVVVSNTVAGVHFVEPDGEGGVGIGVQDDSKNIRVERNAISGSGFAGVIIDHVDGNVVDGNDLVDNANGIIAIGDDNKVTRNTVRGRFRVCDDCGLAISFEGGRDNLIEANVVHDPLRSGIRVASFEPDTPPAVRTIVRGNTVVGADLDGIHVEPTARKTFIERNTAVRSGDDGIDVDRIGTVITANNAHRNADLGIEAVPGVIDGGGNAASGNGNPRQCTNVVCNSG